MAANEPIQVGPGHRFLLDLLQRKLLETIESYVKLNNEKHVDNQNQQTIVGLQLSRLEEKIKRISARQKRYTLEIIKGNGINTIPKESFFAALGLITREALHKLNSKTNERRRRTTANPRFSHEAVQARRLALEPVQKKRQLLMRCEHLQRQINSKVNLIKEKRENNKKLEQQNEDIRKKGLELLSALNMTSAQLDLWIDMKCDESLDGVD